MFHKLATHPAKDAVVSRFGWNSLAKLKWQNGENLTWGKFIGIDNRMQCGTWLMGSRSEVFAMRLLFLLFFRFVPVLQFLQLLLRVVRQVFLPLVLLVLRSLPPVHLEAVHFGDEFGLQGFGHEVGVNLNNLLITIRRMLAKEQPK